MVKKRKRRNSQNKANSNGLDSFLSLLIGYLGYFVNIRPKLGQYERGFFDCLLIVLFFLVVWFKILSKRR